MVHKNCADKFCRVFIELITITTGFHFNLHVQFIMVLIFVYIQYYKEEYTELDVFFADKVLNYVNIIFTSVFSVECILKIMAFNPKVCTDMIRFGWLLGCPSLLQG